MSGIAGFFDFTRDNTAPQWAGVGGRMGEALSPYGEGRQGQWACRAGVLIYRGSSEGPQPLERPLGTARYAIVCTGELYNAPELRRALRAQGHRFATHADAEVILYAYMEYGRGVGEALDGIFAFLIWDALKARAFAARDRSGAKKLFYVNHRETLVLASRSEALWSYPAPDPGREARELGPGEWLAFGAEGTQRGKG